MSHLALHFCLAILLGSLVLAEESPGNSPRMAGSANFHLRSYQGGPPAATVLKRCERLREEFQRVWLAAEIAEDWRPRCEIVLHATRTSYLQAVGRGAGQTSGSSLIRFEKGRALKRRIDLLVKEQGGLPALPHELTHVVLADRFGGRQPPRWIDEGVATTVDTAEKRRLHRRDCQYALRSGTALRVADVLSLERFTSAEQVPAFYGQSLSLVQFLAKQDEPRKILDFAEAAMNHGYDRALRECYNIDGVAVLERKWRDFIATGQSHLNRPGITISHPR